MDQPPLDESHLKRLNECLQSCGHTQKWIEAGARAGLDMSQAIDQNNAHREVSEGLKREFFPKSK